MKKQRDKTEQKKKPGLGAKEGSDAGVNSTPYCHNPTLAAGNPKGSPLVLEDSEGNTMPLSNPSGGSNRPAPEASLSKEKTSLGGCWREKLGAIVGMPLHPMG
jgi:hypothetical protein